MICLVPNCGYMSSASRMLEIYRELRARQVPVLVATHGGTYEHLLRGAGVPYDQIGPRMTAERCARFLRSQVGNGATDQSMYSDHELRTYALAEADYFQTHAVRVAVTGWTLTTLISSRLAGVKLVTEHAGSFVPPVFERGLLPLPTRPPGRLKHLPKRLATKLWNAAPARMSHYCAGFNRIAAELGVAPIPSLAALVLGDLSLVPETPFVLGISPAEMEAWSADGKAGYRPGTRVRYSGPLYARLSDTLSLDVDDFLDDPGPTIYVAINSSGPDLVRTVIDKLAPLKAKLLVVSTVHDLTDVAGERVMVRSVLPSHLVMPRVDLAVTAGGQGTVQTAMASGTPLLGIPIQPEQDLNLVLIERIGAGRRIAQPDIRDSNLTRLAGELINDPSYRSAAESIQRNYHTIDGAANAADAILELL